MVLKFNKIHTLVFFSPKLERFFLLSIYTITNGQDSLFFNIFILCLLHIKGKSFSHR